MHGKKMSQAVQPAKTDKTAAVKPAVEKTPIVKTQTPSAKKEESKPQQEKTAEPVKTTAPAAKTVAAAKTAETKETVKKTASAKKTVKKPKTTKKEVTKTEIVVQYQSNAASITALEDKVKAQFVAEGHRAGCIKNLNIYVKPEDYKAYYVINEKYYGYVDLF